MKLYPVKSIIYNSIAFIFLSLLIACDTDNISSGGSSESSAPRDLPAYSASDIVDIDKAAIPIYDDINNLIEGVVTNTANSGDYAAITAFSIDADPSDNIEYTLTNDASGLFFIETTTGKVHLSNSLVATDLVSDQVHLITVVATSGDQSFSTKNFRIKVVASNYDISELVDRDSFDNRIQQNFFLEARPHISLYAEDQDDTFNKVRYSLKDTADGRFNVDSLTGIVTASQAVSFSVIDSPYEIKAVATSEDGTRSEKSFFINVSPVGPEIIVHFPSNQSITDKSTISIRGVISDIDSSLTINNFEGDQEALVTETGKWSANNINLAEGENIILLTAQDLAGNTSNRSIKVERVSLNVDPVIGQGESFLKPKWLALDSENDALFLVDDNFDEVFFIDTFTGNRYPILDLRLSCGGTGLSNSTYLSGIGFDSLTNKIIVSDKASNTSAGSERLITFDLNDRTCNLLSSDLNGTPSFATPKGDIVSLGEFSLLIDSFRRRLYEINNTTGDRETVFDFDSSGNLSYLSNGFSKPNSLAVFNGKAFVALGGPSSEYEQERIFDAVLAVDYIRDLQGNFTKQYDVIATKGNTLYETPVGSGPELQAPSAIVIDELNNRLLVSDVSSSFLNNAWVPNRSIISIDLDTKVREVVSGSNRGVGNFLNESKLRGGLNQKDIAIDYDVNAQVIYAINEDINELIMIDVVNGDQVIISKGLLE